MTTATRSDYQMFGKAGNYAVRRMVDKIIHDGESGKLRRSGLENAIEAGLRKVAAKHREVYDTAVREIVLMEIDRRLCEPQGWKETYS